MEMSKNEELFITKDYIDHTDWPSLPVTVRILVNPKTAKRVSSNSLTRFHYLADEELYPKIRARQKAIRSSLYWRGIEKHLNDPRKFYHKDFLGRTIENGDIVLILGRCDPRPLVVLSCYQTERVYLEDPQTGGRCKAEPCNLMIISDQLAENHKRHNIELDFSKLKNFHDF